MIDKIDEQLIALLAKNGRATLNDLAKQVNLSVSPCQARIKKLEEVRSTTSSSQVFQLASITEIVCFVDKTLFPI